MLVRRRVLCIEPFVLPFPPSVHYPGVLVSHSGITPLAEDLYTQLAPHINELPPDMPLAFAGHSLGGALGMLLFAMARLKNRRL